MFDKIICPSCGAKISVNGAYSLKPKVTSCQACNTKIKKNEMSFFSFVVKMLISFVVMSVGLSSVLFYIGFSELVAKYIGLVMTFVLLFFWVKISLKWSSVDAGTDK